MESIYRVFIKMWHIFGVFSKSVFSKTASRVNKKLFYNFDLFLDCVTINDKFRFDDK